MAKKGGDVNTMTLFGTQSAPQSDPKSLLGLEPRSVGPLAGLLSAGISPCSDLMLILSGCCHTNRWQANTSSWGWKHVYKTQMFFNARPTVAPPPSLPLPPRANGVKAEKMWKPDCSGWHFIVRSCVVKGDPVRALSDLLTLNCNTAWWLIKIRLFLARGAES